MFKIIKRIYDSKTFGLAFIFSVIGLWLYSILRAPDIFEIFKRGTHTVGVILLFLFTSVMAVWFLYTLRNCFIKTALQIKYRNKPFKFILVYSKDKKNWDDILTSEVKSLIPESCLVIYPSSNDFPDKWVPSVYGINSPGLLILNTQRYFNLWESVRKAGYGYPTKLNNLKVKIKDEIKLSKDLQ